MLDYAHKQFKTSQAAEACKMAPPTLRGYLHRGEFRAIGKKADQPGLATLFSLRDVMVFAVAARLIEFNVPPKVAFGIGVEFGHFGDDDRDPASMFDFREKGETFIAYWPDSQTAEVIAGDDIKGLYDIGISISQSEAVILIKLNPIERQVFAALGFGA
ncbi:hypothetical protein [Blastomonas sp. CCH5-A3]|jgi:hypothetical protein|uniref:hypothetical protein n=1 Tax=Blastomonas sp. CCH5-A3 TaxID=1768761 RepID=UPI0008254590|nr:hypothetical protein [Blastomonas sp. CCH5-A3]MAF62792.1 hypothetical protein [Blastomonas sp.]|tara:strand:- start:59906 stop:60382 length:477 start_codon:yes stop_codon:yes gene_type:complete